MVDSGTKVQASRPFVDARRAVAWQLALGLAAVGLAAALSFEAAWSAALGLACGLAPNLALLGLIGRGGPMPPREFLARLRRGELAKFALTALLFGLVLALRPAGLAPLPLFAAFGATLAGHWLGLLPRARRGGADVG